MFDPECRVCDVPKPPSIIETTEKELMTSEPIKLLLALHQTAIVTGRVPQYHGELLGDVFHSALTRVYETTLKEASKDYVSMLNDCRESARAAMLEEVREKAEKIPGYRCTDMGSKSNDYIVIKKDAFHDLVASLKP